jgi:DNA helicase-2/ATP-dependent DNA helicase PcrA
LQSPFIYNKHFFKQNFTYPEVSQELKAKFEKLNQYIIRLENSFEKNHENPIFEKELFKIDYKSELNHEQLKAVTTIDGKSLVIAGAGTGKTKTLTFRTAYLLENGVFPESILILTFTRKASNELKERVSTLLNSELVNKITSGTFHSFCNLLLLRYADLIGIDRKFNILDQEDSKDLINLVKSESSELSSKKGFPKTKDVARIISISRDRYLTIEKVIQTFYPHYSDYVDDIELLAKLYRDYKKDKNLYDYEDLIEVTIYYLKENSQFREILRNRYRYVMVDEFQDTNIPQKEFLDLIAGGEQNSLMVVGDDHQSIYAFRGANYENILLFGESFPDAKLLKLVQNYRSTPNILNLLNAVSSKITLGYKKELFSEKDEKGDVSKLYKFSDAESEAKHIAKEIKLLHKKGIPLREIAILSRASRDTSNLQIELLKVGVPFIVVGGLKFLERRHVKDILAYMKLLWNPFDAISWHRILTLIDRIGKVTARKIIDTIYEAKGSFSPLLDSKLVKKNDEFERLYKTMIDCSNTQSLTELFDKLVNYYKPILQKVEKDWEERLEDLKVLRTTLEDYRDIGSFLTEIILDPPNEEKSNENLLTEHVTISTIHSAKGLEWHTVFVIALADQKFPHYKAIEDYESLEEEKRLFYVACSRAKENLILTFSEETSPPFFNFVKVSRFIDEIPKKYLKR